MITQTKERNSGKQNQLSKKRQELFEKNGLSLDSKEERTKFYRELYVILHTNYVEECSCYEEKFKKRFSEKFQIDLLKETYDFIEQQMPYLLQNEVVNAIKSGRQVKKKYRDSFLVIIEFNLYLIKKIRKNENPGLYMFVEYFNEKYNHNPEINKYFVKSYWLNFVGDFNILAQEIEPYYDSYQKVLELVLPERESEKKESILDSEKSLEDKEAKINELKMQIEKYQNELGRYKKEEQEKENLFIEGIKWLFQELNSDGYDKVIDYLYQLQRKGSIEVTEIDTLLCYLENFFTALETKGIEPIIKESKVFDIDESRLIKDFLLKFNKDKFDKERVQVEYVGWQLTRVKVDNNEIILDKPIPLERPTLKLGEK